MKKKKNKNNIKITSFSSGGGCGCKVPSDLLKKIINNTPFFKKSKKLLVGNEKSDDSAVYKLSNSKAIVASTDFFTPILDDPEHFGKIAATNALSDIYAMGAKPIFALALLSAPLDRVPINIIKKITSGGTKVCSNAGIMIAGGHTIKSKELIYGLVVIGEINPKKIIKNTGAKSGDKIILTKPLGIGILSSAIKKGLILKKQYKDMIKVTMQLNNCGEILAKENLVSSMTDITGFGLIGHLKEMCDASNKTAVINYKKIPLISGVENLVNKNIHTHASITNLKNVKKAICFSKKISKNQKFILSDPQTSGGLMISTSKKNLKKVIEIIKKYSQYEPSIIGEFTNSKSQIIVV